MLKRIILLGADEGQAAAAEKMKENMGNKGSEGCSSDSYDADKSRLLGDAVLEGILDWKNGCGIVDCGNGILPVVEVIEREECAGDGLLFLTDSSLVLQNLKRMGMYAAAWLHENNREEDLSGAIYAVTEIEELDWESLEKIYLRLAGKPWNVMETERCIIREMTVEDVEAFYRIYAEPSITRYMEDLFPEKEEEIEYTKNYIEKIYGFYGYGLWSIVCKENQEVIGRAGLSWREGFDTPELGFVIGVPYQRKGYAYEVCKAIVAYGKEELGFEKIQALVREGNRASVCLCRKLGFRQEGRVEDKGVWYERYVNGKKRISDF